MKSKNHIQKSRGIPLEEALQKELKNSQFRKHYQQEGVKLKIAYKIAELRQKLGLTQSELARKIGATQSHVARLESADTDNYEIKTLEKIAAAAGKELQVKFV